MIDESRLIDNLKKEWEELCDYSENVETLLEYVIRFIGSQPKIGGWIPCSERLPEERQDVLVFDAYNNMYIANRILSTFFDNEMNDINVIAWQPLPEEYHG